MLSIIFRKMLTALLLCSLFDNLAAQDFITTNYTPTQFNAHRLMWDMAQDKNGSLWFANNNGLIRFDGSNFTNFATPKPVRSLAFNAKGELFVACTGDFGMLKFRANGVKEFVSYKPTIAQKGAIVYGNEKVFCIDNDVYFFTDNTIVKLTHGTTGYKTQTIATNNLLGYGIFNHAIYANVARQGFGVFANGKFNNVNNAIELAGKQLSKLFVYNNRLIIATTYDGFYELLNNKIVKINATTIINSGIVDVEILADNKLAVATLHDGVKILNNDFSVNTTLRLPSNEIYSLFTDAEKNIWVAHAKGVTHVLYNLPLKQFPQFNITGYITDIEIAGNYVNIASTGGIYQTTLTQPNQLVQLSKNECWKLQDGLAACTEGLFVIHGKQVSAISSGQTFLHLQKGNVSGITYAFGTDGCFTIDNKQHIFPLKNITSLGYLVNSLYENADCSFWIGTYHHGLAYFGSQKNNKQIPNSLTDGEVKIKVVDGNPVFISKLGVYKINGNSIEKSQELTALYANIKNTAFVLNTNDWLITENEIYQIANGSKLEQSVVYALSGKPSAIYQHQNTAWVGFEDKIYRATLSSVSSYKLQANVTGLYSGSDKTVFSGFFVNKQEEIITKQEQIPEISFGKGNVVIHVGVNSFLNTQKNRYSYKIDGLQDAWSEWSNNSTITISELKGGRYVLHVKAQNALGQISDETLFSFYVVPPWYASGYAYMLYASMLILLVYFIIVVNGKRLVAKNKELESKIEQRTIELKTEKQKSDELLLNILPAEIADELKQRGEAEPKLFEKVTVLFTDFVGFTTISEQLTPKQLVNEIHYCFMAFDTIIEKNGLEKIKTIGDAYLAVCGMPIADESHAQKVINAALDIQDFMREYKAERTSNQKVFFETRIGVHTGALVAGIVGKKKYAYDIWGDTVNMAARMEQNSFAGKINISGSTYNLVKNKFNCQYRGKIQAKNKGEVDMYFVES